MTDETPRVNVVFAHAVGRSGRCASR
jgi:hypothetical protein